jgi:drug/metabolite transporter (DMT)-like permease
LLYFAPLLAAIIYPLGSLWTKQAQVLGAGPWRIAVVGNLIIAICFLPLLLLRPEPPNWEFFYWPMIVGGCYFGGQFFTVLALRWGDVSMVAPMMGCKVLFVGLYSTMLGLEELSSTLWISAGLTALAIFLLGYTSKKQPSRRSPWLAVSLALVSCAFFAGVDTGVGYAGSKFGAIPILVIGIWFFALSSLLLTPLALREPAAPKALPPITSGSTDLK